MREELKALDELEMDDLWERARVRIPGTDGSDPRRPHGKRASTFAVVATALVVLGLVVWTLRPLGENTHAPPAATPVPILPVHAKVAATIPIRSSPSAIAAGAGGVWVAAPLTRFPMDNDSVGRIDPTTNEVVARIAVPQFYGDVADVTANATSVWVTAVRRYNEQTLDLTTFQLDPTSDRLGAPIEGVGGQLAIAGDTLWALAAGTDATPTEIVRIDAGNGTLLSRTPLGGTGTDIVLGDGSVYVPILTSSQGVHDIAQIDASTGQLARTISLDGVHGTYESPVVARGSLWIPVCCTDNTVMLYQVDPSSGETVGEPISVADGLPFGSAFGNILSMSERGRLDGIDPASGTVTTLAQSEWPASHTSMVYDATTQAVWVSNYKEMVTRIDIRPADVSSSPSGSETAATGEFYLEPYLAGGQGWNSRSSAPVSATGKNGTTAWASTIPISEEDVKLRAAIPPTTISALPPDGIIVTVEVVPASYQDTAVPFPYADRSYDLSTATERGPEAEEPTGKYSVLEIDDPEAATLVRVYFGTANVTNPLLAKAQTELDTLQLPPTCTVGGPGSLTVSASATAGSPGDTITLTGRIPLQRQDGSFDESGSGRLVAWWNANPDDWPYLASDPSSASVIPGVQGEGGIIELGTSSMDSCLFEIQFVVPSVTRGDYPVVVLQQGGGGATLVGSVVIQVR
jgi:hypothetical protein